MPKKAKELSPIEVRNLKHTGRGRNEMFPVGGISGLALQITPNGGRSWVLRMTVGENRRHIGLGGYPDVSLSSAREKAREARELVQQGIDPIARKADLRAKLIASQQRGLTFSDAVEKFLIGKLNEFRNDKHKKQWRSTIDNYAVPKIGDMLVQDILISDIQRVLEPIWLEKNETARRLRGRVEKVIAWATVAGHRTGDNPARWQNNLDAILPKPSRIQTIVHHPALKLIDASRWFGDLKAREGIATRALEFTALTAARSGEVRAALWNEIDIEACLWIKPAEKTKTAQEHRVPLTPSMVKLLDALPRLQGSDYIFPAPRGGMLSDAALSACMRRIHAADAVGYVDRVSGRPAVPHGLRSTFRDWAAERTEYPREMAEISLAHNVGNDVERAYRRGDMVEKRRAMMGAWEKFLEGVKGRKIVELKKTR